MAYLKVQPNYFRFILTSLRWFGISIQEIKNPINSKLYNIYAIFLSITCIYYYIVAEIIDLILHIDDFEYVSFNLCYLINQFAGVLKGTLFLLNRKSLQKYFENLESGYFLPNPNRGGKEEFILIQRAIRNCTYQCLIFYFFVITVVTNRAISSTIAKDYEVNFDNLTNSTTFEQNKMLPYPIYLPFDTKKYYKLAFAYQMFACTLYGLYIGASDALITGIMIHLKAQLIILKNSLKNIIPRAYVTYNSEYANKKIIDNALNDNSIEKLVPQIQKEVTKIVNDVIQHHQQIINLADNTEVVFNLIILIQFLTSLLLACLLLFQLSLYDVKSTTFISMVFYLFLMLFQLLIYCWNGNEMELESLDVARAVFESDWIRMDNGCQKALSLMICRAQRPLRLSAGKFAFVSLETYTTILRGSASYFLALKNINE